MWHMTEPLGSLSAKAAQLVLREARRRWLQAGELDRLIDRLDRRFGDTTGLTVTQLQTWTSNEGFRDALFDVSYTGDWETHRGALLDAVLALIAADPGRPSPEERGLARELVEAIEELLPIAKQGDELVRYEGKVTRAELGPTRVRVATVDWAPERAQDLIAELLDRHPEEGVQLQQELSGSDLASAFAVSSRRRRGGSETGLACSLRRSP